jgi:hypothetical protein
VKFDGSKIIVQFAAPGSTNKRQGALTRQECQDMESVDMSRINEMANLTGEIPHQGKSILENLNSANSQMVIHADVH